MTTQDRADAALPGIDVPGAALPPALRILVVDDEPGMRSGAERALGAFLVSVPEAENKVGFVITQAESAESAETMIAADCPDILLLDYKLPGMSGIELIQRIHPAHPELVIIFMTAYASIETAVTAIKAGAYDFLAKPFTPAELKNTICKAATGILLRARARRLVAERRQIRFQFISVLAHELKSPLNAVQGYLNIVKDRTAGDDAATYKRILGQSLTRIAGMKKLINDLLEMTGIESGQKARELAPLEIGALAAAALETAAPSAAARAITLKLDCPTPVRLLADPGEIEMVLNNLVSNAVKYNRDKGEVAVSIRRDGGEVVIRVADTGIGLAADEAKRLFGEFVRIKNEKTRGILGTGLGLSIVAKIAALYRGAAKVESEPEQGSIFTVILAGPEGP